MEKSKIKVLWFSNTPANGVLGLNQSNSGSGTWLSTLDLALQNQVELNIAFYYSKNIQFTVGNTKYYGIAKYKNFIEKIKFKILERFFDFVFDEEHLTEYKKIVNLVSPDLIHIHGTENPFGCLIGQTKIPIVVSIQGFTSAVLNYYSVGLGETFIQVKNRSLKSLKDFFFPTNFNNAKKKFIKMSFIEKRNLSNCNYVIGRTEWDKIYSSILTNSRTYFHNDEIMRIEFYNNHWKPKDRVTNELYIHTTADNVYYKGLETICDTIIFLKSKGYKCIWTIAGVLSSDLIVYVLQKKYGKQFPKEALFFLGRLTAEQLISQMIESDCYVMASNIENSPNSLCEAMLLGMPCIATNVGGTGSILTNGFNGVLVQSGDYISIAAMILKIKKENHFSNQLSVNAKESALNRHSHEKIVNELIEIYHSIIITNKYK